MESVYPGSRPSRSSVGDRSALRRPLSPPRGNVPSQRGDVPPKKGNVPPSWGNVPPQRLEHSPNWTDVPPRWTEHSPKRGEHFPAGVEHFPCRVEHSPNVWNIPPGEGSALPVPAAAPRKRGDLPPSRRSYRPRRGGGSPGRTGHSPAGTDDRPGWGRRWAKDPIALSGRGGVDEWWSLAPPGAKACRSQGLTPLASIRWAPELRLLDQLGFPLAGCPLLRSRAQALTLVRNRRRIEMTYRIKGIRWPDIDVLGGNLGP